jgi:hypothetical protein
MPKEGEIQDEGDHVAGRRFQDAERSFAENESLLQRKAREEAGRVSGEGKATLHPPAHKSGNAVDPHTDENLDKGLDETFPASDPVSISPGAD